MEQMASASSSVFFFTCSSCAAWISGSRVSLAPQLIRPLSRSHSSSWLTLYLQSHRHVSAERSVGCGRAALAAPPSPDLHALAPGAHVLAQQQVVQGDGPDDVELLLHHLLDELRVGAVLAHDGVEGVELP